MTSVPSVLCIHDLSCVGRCSLTVVAPVLSAMGVQACVLPTALYSTHTGGFGAPVVQDMAAFARQALQHFARQELRFHAVYTGYLANAAQAAVAEQALLQYPDALKVVDPVLGDNGHLYSGMSEEMCAVQRRLCTLADLITPNATEAALLANGEPSPAALHEQYHCDVVMKGFAQQGVFTNAWCDATSQGSLPFTRVPGDFHGTGDLFAAVLVGARVRGVSLAQAVQQAENFVATCVRHTPPQQERFGVLFEPYLALLGTEEGGKHP